MELQLRKLTLTLSGSKKHQLLDYIRQHALESLESNRDFHWRRGSLPNTNSTNIINVLHKRYYLTAGGPSGNNSNEITDIDEYKKQLGRRTRGTGDHLINKEKGTLFSLGYEVLGMYELDIVNNNIDFMSTDALVLAVPCSDNEYKDIVIDYVKSQGSDSTHTVPLCAVIVIVHTQSNYERVDAEAEQDRIVDELRERIQDEQLKIRPAHIFVDLECDTTYPYREYLTNTALQNMLHTIWMLKPREKTGFLKGF